MHKSSTTLHALIDTVQRQRHAVLDAARAGAIEKQHARGHLTARERIAALLDADSFIEQGVFAQPLRNNRFNADLQAPADGMVTGTGMVDGRPVVVAAVDFTVHGGSIGTVGRNKIVRAARRAGEAGMPLILLLEGGGHRIQDGLDARHFAQGNPIWDVMARMLNRGEAVNALKRAIYTGRVGPAQARRADEMQAVADALSLLANIVMAWNTAQMQAVLDRWANRRQIVPPELTGRIAPTRLEGINLRGVFRFPLERYAGQILPSQNAGKTSAAG